MSGTTFNCVIKIWVVSSSVPDMKAEDKHDSGCAYRKQHVLFVLVDGSGVGNRVSVFDDGHGLP